MLNSRMLPRDMFDTYTKHVSADLYLGNMRTWKSIFYTGVDNVKAISWISKYNHKQTLTDLLIRK